MIEFRQLALARAGHLLLEGATLQLHPGWRVGLVGANGTGKSSLLSLIAGELEPERGACLLPPHWTLARVRQETPALPDPAWDFVLAGDPEFFALEAEMRAAESMQDGARLARLFARYEEIDGYSARARSARILAGLGFDERDFSRPVAEFSGGWRVRLNLARALFRRADVLLLDEPTNHLDLDAVLWLEDWLKNARSVLILVSHDRDFLDAVVNHVMAIEQGRLQLHRGDYSDYERRRAERLANEAAARAAQERRVAHLHSFIERFRAKASKARQAQSRIKALARMETVAAAHVDSPFSFAFPPPKTLPDPLLELAGGAAGHGGTALLTRLTITLRPGCRIGLLGPNGAGKSTFIKLLARELPLREGERREARNLSIGYFAQHQLETLRPEETPLQHLQREAPEAREQELRDYLGGFGFPGEMASRVVRDFSGGEKSRLVLALLIRRAPNLFLLDEPTNHLDLEMRAALAFALQDYSGGIVLVSHDRHLLRSVVDEFWLVGNGSVAPFAGDLEDYANWLTQHRNSPAGSNFLADGPAGGAKQGRSRKNDRAQDKELLRIRRTLEKELAALEEEIERLTGAAQTLLAELAAPALYAPDADRQEILRLHQRQQEIAATLAQAENRWLEIQEQLEALPEADKR
ncbi:MAG: ATP-binding cassette domain-containing protein [Zoogloeaceae bacterium]|nr:ATP-binding cassette domain-containing protein [Zoogloeaceae bacterium]